MPKPKLPFKEFAWSPELAYVAGLLVTDGNLSGDGRHITMRSIDRYLLETFCKCLNLNSKIARTKDTHNDGYIRKPCYRIQFSNVQFYNWLVKIGITPAKTHTIGIIEVPDIFFKDFLRGHLDGDGSISAYKDSYNFYKGRGYVANRLFIRFISASKPHIVWLRNKISHLDGVNGALIEEKSKKENRVSIWEVKFAKKESVKLLNLIYYKPDLPTLSRKRLLAEKSLETISNETRKKYAWISV